MCKRPLIVKPICQYLQNHFQVHTLDYTRQKLNYPMSLSDMGLLFSHNSSEQKLIPPNALDYENVV